MQKYHGVVQDASGRAIGGAAVRVLVSDTQVAASLFDDNGNALAQPLIADGYGRHGFKVENGVYDIVASYGGRSQALRKVTINDGTSFTTQNAFSVRIYFGVTLAFNYPLILNAPPPRFIDQPTMTAI